MAQHVGKFGHVLGWGHTWKKDPKKQEEEEEEEYPEDEWEDDSPTTKATTKENANKNLEIIKETELKILTTDECLEQHKSANFPIDLDGSRQFCTYAKGTDACQGKA